jgi:PAS domain S-box-containing protein
MNTDSRSGPMDVHAPPSARNGAHVQLKRSFHELAEREARLSRLVDMLFDGTLVVRDGVIIETNQGLMSMTGYDASELVGRRIQELEGWEDFGRVLEAVSGECVSLELSLPRKCSRPVCATVKAVRVSIEGSELVIAVIAGMTEHEPASTSLLRSAERYRSLFDSVPDLVYTKDTDLKFSEVNPAMEKTLELPASQIVGRTAAQLYGEEAGERIRAWDLRVLSGETIEEEHAVIVKGEKLTFHDVRVPIRNSAGQIVGVCCIGRDVTERRASAPTLALAPSGYRSKAMAETMELAGQAASTDSIVLLLGESGSGKDHLATWIHDRSKRSGSPFLTINCAAVPQELAESELFGHESGAFTGARSRKKGLLELAEGGTLLLNEVGELSLSLQSKLLVFLDSRSFYRVGGQSSIRVDARILAATHKDLEAEVEAGRFSKPLYYRLNVFPIHVPPLRDRIEDIPLLARELISKVAKEMNLSGVPPLDSESLRALTMYRWPGNVRELRNVLEKGLIQWQTGKLKLNVPSTEPEANQWSFSVFFPPGKKLSEVTREVAGSVCMEAIRRSGGNRSAAARSLGLSRDSLYRYLRRRDGGYQQEPSS